MSSTMDEKSNDDQQKIVIENKIREMLQDEERWTHHLVKMLEAFVEADQTVEFKKHINSVFTILKAEKPDETLGFIIDDYYEGLDTMMVKAVKNNNLDIVRTLIRCHCDTDHSSSDNETPIYWACKNNNLSMVKLLMQNKTDPNIITRHDSEDPGTTTMIQAAIVGNFNIMKELLNVKNEYKHSFDWNKLINHRQTSDGYSAFHYLCSNGHSIIIKALLLLQKPAKVKMDINLKTKYQLNPLLCACYKNQTRTIKCLLEYVYNNETDEKAEIINDVDAAGYTAFSVCCYNGNIEGARVILDTYQDKLDINKGDNANGLSPFHRACQNGQDELIKFLLNNDLFKSKFDINLQDKWGRSPLMVAAASGNLSTVSLLCELPDVKILEIKDNNGANAVDASAYYGQVAAFSSLMLALFKRNNITNFEQLAQSNLFSQVNTDKWFNWLKTQKNGGFYSFLVKLVENGIHKRRFSVVLSYLASNVNINDANYNLYDNYIKLKQSESISKYLFDNLSESARNELFEVITKGMLSNNLCFTDELLFLCKMVNNDKFVNVLQTVTKESLSYENKDVYKLTYFKNYLANSYIWTNNNTADEKQADTDNSDSVTLFETINKSVISDELLEHKKYIKAELEKIETELDKVRTRVKLFDLSNGSGISQNSMIGGLGNSIDYMSQQGTLPEYSLNSMPYDNINGFNGEDQYDYNSYLTKLLLTSHEIDPIFQVECESYFNKLGLECKYASAPVKTRQRCITKAKLEYNNKKWPKTSHILDTVRASITFYDIKSFLSAFKKFRNEFDYKKIDEHGNQVIQCIVRIKNDFKSLPKNISEISLDELNYCDIKVNVLLEYNGKRIIGELQFLLSIFLDFKKRQHSIYSFIRNEDYYKKLNKLELDIKLNRENAFYKLLRKYILSHNFKQFSLLVTSLSMSKENQLLTSSLLDENEWTRGKQFFEMVRNKSD